MKHTSEDQTKSPINRHKAMAMGKDIKAMKKGGAIKKACGGMMKKGGKIDKKKK